MVTGVQTCALRSSESLGRELLRRDAKEMPQNGRNAGRSQTTLTEQDLRELKGFGSKALDEVRDKMAELEF